MMRLMTSEAFQIFSALVQLVGIHAFTKAFVTCNVLLRVLCTCILVGYLLVLYGAELLCTWITVLLRVQCTRAVWYDPHTIPTTATLLRSFHNGLLVNQLCGQKLDFSRSIVLLVRYSIRPTRVQTTTSIRVLYWISNPAGHNFDYCTS
jgi:hypothetical protein